MIIKTNTENSLQRTLKDEITISGTGLMHGLDVNAKISPAPENHGITFQRLDLWTDGHRDSIQVCPENIIADLPRCTSIGQESTVVNSVEHILSALAGMEIDNAAIQLDAPELPALDGSAQIYATQIAKVGMVEQNAVREVVKIDSPVAIDQGDKQLVLLPSETFRVTFGYDHPQIKTQTATFEIKPETYLKQIASARSFCLESEIEVLLQLGIGKGATEDNVVVVNERGKSKIDLRFPDEFVRHKILDLIGDLSTISKPLQAHVVAMKSGHQLHATLVQSLAEQGLLNQQTVVEAKEIYQYLPHRFPMCMLDRVLSYETGKSAIGIKNLTYNEQFFQGHFPQEPVMPGVLQMEALAQLGAWLVLQETAVEDQVGYFASIEEAKFRRPVLPGDQLRLEIEVVRKRQNFVKLAGKAYVGDVVASEGNLSIMLGSASSMPK